MVSSLSSKVPAEKYFSAAALIILLYDHCITLGPEIGLIWLRRPWSTSQRTLVFLRYLVAASQIYTAFALSGLFHHGNQIVWLFVSAASCGLSLAIIDIVLVLRLYALWDHRRRVLYGLLAGFVMSFSSTIAFGTLSMAHMLPNVSYEETFHMCILSEQPRLWVGLWASQVFFDIWVFGSTVVNAASRPRGADVKLIKDIQRDGGLFFFGLFALRLVNMLLSAFDSNPEYMVIGFFFTWTMVAVIMSRLLLRLEQMTSTRCSGSDRAASVSVLPECHNPRDEAHQLISITRHIERGDL